MLQLLLAGLARAAAAAAESGGAAVRGAVTGAADNAVNAAKGTMTYPKAIMETLQKFTADAGGPGKAPTGIVQSGSRNAFNGMVEHEGEKIAVKDGIATKGGNHYFVSPEGNISDGKSKLVGIVKDGKVAPMDTENFMSNVLGRKDTTAAPEQLAQSIKGTSKSSPEEVLARAEEKQKQLRETVQRSNDSGQSIDFTSLGTSSGHDLVRAQIENDVIFPQAHTRQRARPGL